jgi:hypothetical protein
MDRAMALGILSGLATLMPTISGVLDKVLPDEKAREAARHALVQLELEGNLKELEHQLSAIVTEAKSADPWTSRARPSFLYVVYIYILAAIPFGFAYMLDPVAAGLGVEGVKAWLAAIPDSMWGLFGVGYLGYTGARSYDKSKLQG